ncbi:GIY-YIG nuclease family protein [Candidatus Parcubacteria bacterium]|nr:GIY-YIG nuclease family protein [Candidatus Parcubacteria bacterium]MBI4385222.1 GIY-YIG nuclease family protein [Candidatus Parcubacteria bacterium]
MPNEVYFVYIVKSEKDGGFYTGLTKDPQRRLHEHNKSDTKTTRSRKPWKIVYLEQCGSLTDARKREKFLKSGSGREFRGRILPG